MTDTSHWLVCIGMAFVVGTSVGAIMERKRFEALQRENNLKTKQKIAR